MSAELSQNPATMWIGCSDSRVPEFVRKGTERGTVFVHRNIGNQIDPRDNTNSVLAAIEYALTFDGLQKIYVVGHTRCGAVQHSISVARVEGGEDIQPPPQQFQFVTPYLQTLVSDAKGIISGSPGVTGEQLELNVITQNVKNQVKRIGEGLGSNPRLWKVRVEGYVYHIGESDPWRGVARLERKNPGSGDQREGLNEKLLYREIDEHKETLEL